MNSSLRTSAFIVFLIVLLLLGSSLYTVREGQKALLLKLGELTKTLSGQVREYGPGLHFKIPFINHVRVFDVRLQTLDIKSSRIVTLEKKDVMVDYYVKWRIEDLAKYFKATGGNEFKAQTLLEQKLNTALRAEFGKRTIADVVSGERDDVMEILKAKADVQAQGLGVAIQDVRIKGIDLPESTSEAIYQRMRADMEKIANRHRADGKRDAEAIQAKADAKVTVLLAKVNSEGKEIRAKGQADAARIYAEAYQKNPEFFALYRSLKAYEESFNSKQDVLVLNDSSQFFDYFKSFPNETVKKAG
jgi:membrane protease subunit HflC